MAGNLNALNITPSAGNTNGIIFSQLGVGLGTILGTTGAGQYFTGCYWSAETGSGGGCDQNNGWSYYQNPSTSLVNWTWTGIATANGQWIAWADAFKGPASASGTLTPARGFVFQMKALLLLLLSLPCWATTYYLDSQVASSGNGLVGRRPGKGSRISPGCSREMWSTSVAARPARPTTQVSMMSASGTSGNPITYQTAPKPATTGSSPSTAAAGASSYTQTRPRLQSVDHLQRQRWRYKEHDYPRLDDADQRLPIRSASCSAISL